MSGGGNGLKPAEVLRNRDKCPDSPSKHRYTSVEEAWKAARQRSHETGMEIVPYLCSGCGYSHLTKKTAGSDVIARADVGVTTGAARKKLGPPLQLSWDRSQTTSTLTPVEEPPVDLSEVRTYNQQARRKVIVQLLSTNPTPMTAELAELLPGVSAQTLREDMRALGFTIERGPRQRWQPRDYSMPPAMPPLSLVPTPMGTSDSGDDTSGLDDAIARHPSVTGGWADIDIATVGHLPLRDVLAVLAAAGIDARVQVRRGGIA